jgi:polar amino acid transport system permease protein
VVQFYVERHYSKGALRTVPLTPIQKLRSRIAALPLSPRGATR